MVYCSYCGILNSADANVCSECGKSLQVPQREAENPCSHSSSSKDYPYHQRGAGMGALFFGIVIVMIGLSMLFPEVSSKIPWWPIVLIIVGGWLIITGLRMRNKTMQTGGNNVDFSFFHVYLLRKDV